MRCNTLISLVLAGLASICLCSCRKEAPKASRVIISESRISLRTGQTFTLTATVEPNDCDSPVEWSSSDRNVARCNQGAVEGISAGTTVIKASADEVFSECKVSVYSGTYKISGKTKVSKTGYGTYASTLEYSFSDGETISLEWEGTADFS